VERAMQDARIELLQRMAIFGGVRADILEYLLAFCSVLEIPCNEYFFHEGDEGDALFVLQNGKAVVLKSCDRQEQLIQTLVVGDCFGEMAVIDHCRRSASVRAVEDCTAIRISSGDLYRVYGQDVKQFALIQMNMGREISRRLRAANERLIGAGLKSDDPLFFTA
jgi:CRP-like cAMP-binding protein